MERVTVGATLETSFENEYVTVRIDRPARLVLIDRKNTPFQQLTDFVATVDDILAAVTEAGARQYGLLYDTRHGPPPGGEAYMKAFTRMAEELASRFERIAAVVTDVETLEAVRGFAPASVDFFIQPAAARAALEHMAKH
jgi:hypothetical protein